MERDLLLLGLLRRHDMHGYQLHEFIEKYMQTCVDLKKPTAYYLLEKMAQAGYITQSEEREGNRPPRRVYTVTAVGETHFQQLLAQNLADYQPARFGGAVGLAFVDALEGGDAAALLSQRRTILRQHLAQAQSAPPHSGSLQLVLEHQIVHLQSELTWLDEVIARLEGEVKSEQSPVSGEQ